MSSSLIRNIKANELKGLIETSSNTYWNDGCVILEPKAGKLVLNFTQMEEFRDCNSFTVQLKRVSGNGLVMISCGILSQEHQIVSKTTQNISCSFNGSKIQFHRTQRSTGELAILNISMYRDSKPSTDWNRIIANCTHSCLRLVGDQLHASSGAWIKGINIKVQTSPENSYHQNGDEIKFIAPCRIVDLSVFTSGKINKPFIKSWIPPTQKPPTKIKDKDIVISTITNEKNGYINRKIEHYNLEANTIDFNNNNTSNIINIQNSWKDYDDYLFKGIDLKNKVALDFGCGFGRNIVKFSDMFARIDGVDFSPNALEKARVWTDRNGVNGSRLFQNNGIDLSGISNNSYDIVFSTLCFQFICSHEMRESLFSEIYRVLNPGGWISIQMGYKRLNKDNITYYRNHYDGDNEVSVDYYNYPKSDLDKIGFSNYSYDLRSVGPGDINHEHWIFFRAQKK